MFLLGCILFLVGFFLAIPILKTIGLIVGLVGLVLLLLSMAGSPVGRRRYW